MSDRFHPVSPARIAGWIFRELDQKNSVFGIPRELFYVPGGEPFTLVRGGRRLETPVGVAAGPHTQMAQNLVVAWLLGARFLELKTVQTLDELDVTKPCIDAADLTYNCEWSQELRLTESLREYLSAWVIIHALKHRLGWGPGSREPGFEFNVSVGYNLEGIQKANVQEFLDRATVDAGEALAQVIVEVAQVYPAVKDLAIPSRLADSVTLSTMHGCPPDEIERIARYLIEDRGLHTTVKLNPTLLGPAALREILNERLGHRDVTVPDEAFAHDLKYDDAVGMIRRLKAAAAARGVTFGLKLTNTLETLNLRHVLPEKERMHYLSGRALHPLTLALARKLLDELQASVPMSISGGADAFNLPEILACGLAPVTVCTDLLKPGGYARLPQYLRLLREAMRARRAADLEDWIVKSATTQPDFGDEALRLIRDLEPRLPADAVTRLERRMPALQATLEDPFADLLRRLVTESPANLDQLRVAVVRAGQRLNAARYAENLVADPSYAARSRPFRAKGDRTLGWFDCVAAPCQEACPAGQNIPDYLHFVAAGDDGAAIREILDTNALPCTTGAVCDHPCVSRCVRNHYDHPLAIREIKRFAAANADFRSSPDHPRVERVAIVGAGPAGLSAAYVLAQAGVGVTIFESRDGAGGMAARVIPTFRLPEPDLDRDLARVRDLGVDLRLGVRFGVDVDIATLRREGYHALILATGAPGGRLMGIAGEDAAGVMDGLTFLTEVRAGRPVDLGADVLVVGGGNAAMDAARTAWRVAPAAAIGLLYRRTRAEMPADPDEIEAALAEGIALHELVMPTRVKAEGGHVVAVECVRMTLGEPDASGRRAPVPVPGSEHERPCSELIVCVSQAPELRYLDGSGVKVTRHETVQADPETGETSVPGIFAGGDLVRGPATVIKAVRDGRVIAETLLARRQIAVPRRPRRLPKGLSDGELLRRRSERQPREPQDERPPEERRDLDEVVGVMSEEAARQEAARCLVCNEMCSLCVTVCPNRANQAYEVPPTVRSMPAYRVGAGALGELPGRVVRVAQRIQIVNVTNLCNECGNCATFCPTAGAPYRDKPRLHLDAGSYAAERDRALLVERVGPRHQIRARVAGVEHVLRQDGRTLAYQSPRIQAVLDADDLGVLDARPGPEAVDGDVIGLEVALYLNVILNGLTRSLPHLF